jgi:hypothetical protein
MVQRYAHLSPEHLRKAVEKLVTPINPKAQIVNEQPVPVLVPVRQ